MKHNVTVAITSISASIVVFATGTAYADPATPQAGAPCWASVDGGALDNAQTLTPQGEVLLCVKNDQGSQWQHLDGLQRPVETFFTAGPEQTLTAEDIGDATVWVSAPAGSGAVCTAVEIPSDGGQPVTKTNDLGHFNDFSLIPNLSTLKVSGHCNWRKAWNRFG